MGLLKKKDQKHRLERKYIQRLSFSDESREEK